MVAHQDLAGPRASATATTSMNRYTAEAIACRSSILQTEIQKAKNSVRDALKQRLNENGGIDFVVEGE
jgi:hypothetical protein